MGNYHQSKSKAKAQDRAVSWANCLERTSTTLILSNMATVAIHSKRPSNMAILTKDTRNRATLTRDTAVAMAVDTAEGTRSSHQEEGAWARWELVLLVWGVGLLVVYCWPMHWMVGARMMEGVAGTMVVAAEISRVESTSMQNLHGFIDMEQRLSSEWLTECRRVSLGR
jgi:hypothetical protein